MAKSNKSGKPDTQNLKKARVQFDESDACDVAIAFASGRSINTIAKILTAKKGRKVSRQRVVSLLQRAFRDGFVPPLLADPTKLSEQLARNFPRSGVRFSVISARNRFPFLAARQILNWIVQTCDSQSGSYVALGGGLTMAQIVDEVRGVLELPANIELRDWFRKATLRYVNATAGFRATEPELEASYLTCRLAQSMIERGEVKSGKAVIHSVAADPPMDQVQAVADVRKHARVFVSGVGTPPDAYCIKALKEKKALTHEQEKTVAVEFLYRLFDLHGDQISVPIIGGIDDTDTKKHMLRTLFDVEPSASEGTRAVIAVADCTPENRKRKAKALYVLLEHGKLTHVCLSADLATALFEAVTEFAIAPTS